MSRLYFLAPILIVSGVGCKSSSFLKKPGETIVLKDASWVDPRAKTLRRGTLVIRDGKIAQALEGSDDIPDAEQVISLKGKYLLPGLVDLHGHTFGNPSPLESDSENTSEAHQDENFGTLESLRRALFCGVIAVVDLGSSEVPILDFRNKSQSGSISGARLFAVGPVLGYGVPSDKKGGYRGMRNPMEARTQIEDLAKSKPDFIKVIFDARRKDRPSLDQKTLEAAIDSAHAKGLRVIVHIGTWKNAESAARAKADVITHFFDDEIISSEALKAMKENQVISIPTFAVQTEMAHIVKGAVLNDPLLRQIASPALLAQYLKRDQYSSRAEAWAEDQGEDEIRDTKTLKLMARAGITMLAGSDAGNPGVFQGFSIHREIELWVHAGLSIWDSLAAATTKAAEFLGIQEGFRPGDRAHFVVLSRSPLEDIRATRAIEGVLFDGQWVDRARLAPQFTPERENGNTTH